MEKIDFSGLVARIGEDVKVEQLENYRDGPPHIKVVFPDTQNILIDCSPEEYEEAIIYQIVAHHRKQHKMHYEYIRRAADKIRSELRRAIINVIVFMAKHLIHLIQILF